VSATFLLTPDRRNDGLTPTRVLGVVFHVIVENLNFNCSPRWCSAASPPGSPCVEWSQTTASRECPAPAGSS